MLAPYGKLLVQLLSYIPNPDFSISIYVGKFSYENAKHWLSKGQICLCLPFDKNIQDFDWPVKNLKIYVVDTGGIKKDDLYQMAAFLLQKGALVVDVQDYFDLGDIFVND